MAEPDDILGNIGLGAMAVGLATIGVIGEGVKAVGGVAESAVKAVGDVASTAISAPAQNAADAHGEKTQSKYKYTGEVGKDAIETEFTIPVRRISDKGIEEHEQSLLISCEGVWLCTNFTLTEKEEGLFGIPVKKSKTVSRRVAELKVGNCELIKKGKTRPDEPLERGFAGSILGAMTAGPAGFVAGGALGAISSFIDADDIWHAKIETVDGQEYEFLLKSKDDGDRLLEALDCTLGFAD